MSQQKYLCIQRSQGGQCEPPSPAQMEQMFAKFNAWKEKFKDNILDMGGKLEPSGAVVKSDSVIDGPFVEVKEIIGGYMLIQANNIEQAMQVVKESPGVAMPGSSVEIRPIAMP
ncbi:MAG: YciI family protein [Kangiellaceae bacterium]|nr:YciI family protein [Kangiellaceae bacterium]MCW9000201.1 YciI family protein [Kangiellaceae bacterium]MCW9018064.1 YciI family protein [Kangiellaceae bacterium]